jgi:hypothetical protein
MARRRYDDDRHINGRPRSPALGKKRCRLGSRVIEMDDSTLKVLTNRLAKTGFKLLVVAVLWKNTSLQSQFEDRDRFHRTGSGARLLSQSPIFRVCAHYNRASWCTANLRNVEIESSPATSCAQSLGSLALVVNRVAKKVPRAVFHLRR